MPDHALETAALVTLLRGGSRPWQEYAGLIEEAGSALKVLAEEHAASLLDPDTAAAQADVARWNAQGLQLLTVLDRDYPENLRGVHDRPPLIFVAGELRPGDSRSIAVVGTRRPSRAGIEAARRIASHLVSRGFTVVSGLAAGIDTAAHSAALEIGGRTVAVIGSGANRSYPPQNAGLQRRIARTGAVISQFWPDAPPSRRSFPMRNAVMSGLTLATMVVEASETSGTRIQARLALKQGRPVFMTPALIEQQQWARELAQTPGTHVIKAPSEITTIVGRLTAPDALVG